MSVDLELTAHLHQWAQRLAADELPAGWDIVPGDRLPRRITPELRIYYREFRCRSPLDNLRGLLLGSPATRTRSWRRLRYVGIGAPENLAWGKLPGAREYLFTEAPAGRDIATWLTSTVAGRAGETLAIRRQLLEALGIFVGRVHATGFVPGDLKASDVFAARLEDRFQFTLINNERTVQKQPPSGRMLLRNLMELNLLPPAAISRTDRMRFLSPGVGNCESCRPSRPKCSLPRPTTGPCAQCMKAAGCDRRPCWRPARSSAKLTRAGQAAQAFTHYEERPLTFTAGTIEELNLLLQPDSSTLDRGIKVHSSARREVIAACQSLFDRGWSRNPTAAT